MIVENLRSVHPRHVKLGFMVFCAILLLLTLLLSRCDPAVDKENLKREIWREVNRVAPQYQLDPGFVYSIIFAESSFNPRAETHVARGLMQLTRQAWEQVSDLPYRQAWNWKTNIQVGCAYLAWCRERFVRNGRQPTYPLLAAAYHYGFGKVLSRGFDMKVLGEHSNHTYRKLFAGELQPVPAPAPIK
jgi:hypothetical protein